MADRPKPIPSFAPHRRWRIGFDLTLRTVLLLAVVVMINYLGTQYFKRFYLSSQTRIQLSTRTVSVLQALTNQLTVTLYFDKQGDNAEFYPTILALLNEYRTVNPKLTVRTVDYVRDPGEAEKVKAQYKLTSAKDLVIFDLGGRVETVDADALTQYVMNNVKQVSGEKELEFLKKPVSFSGEMTFTSRLLALENPQPLNAYFLQGDGETSLQDPDKTRGYLTFGMILGQNYLAVRNLELSGYQEVPADCSLLIIAAPTQALTDLELQKIDHYLAQGGRLFVLLDYRTIEHPTGLETILQRWGINVAADYVIDPDNTITGQDIKVQQFNPHSPIVGPLAQLSLHMILPRPVSRVNWVNPPANAPDVQELALSGPNSTLAGDKSAPPQSYSLIASAEQKTVAGVTNPHGNTRIVAAGDSIFLGNYYIQDVANRAFLDSSINWLLDRTALVSGIAPQNITEYRLVMTQKQQHEIRWILLGVLPGIILLLGGLVWFTRRK
jgi:hypothetical protein